MTRGTRNSVLLGMALVALVCPWAVPGKAQAAPPCKDVALVLAIDASGSVSAGEFLLQRQGIAAAFRDPSVLEVIRSAGRVAVSAVIWGSEGMPKSQSDWVEVDSAAGAEQFARTIEAMPREVTGDTGLGAALVTSLARLTAKDMCAVRKIINLSGDGRETLAVRGKRRYAPAPVARDLASSLGVEINALAISNEEPDLARYYTQDVITGPDAFVMEVRDYGGFADALRRKLIREISPRVVAELPSLPPGPHRLN